MPRVAPTVLWGFITKTQIMYRKAIGKCNYCYVIAFAILATLVLVLARTNFINKRYKTIYNLTYVIYYPNSSDTISLRVVYHNYGSDRGTNYLNIINEDHNYIREYNGSAPIKIINH